MGQSKVVNKRTENTWGNQKPYTEEGQTIQCGNQSRKQKTDIYYKGVIKSRKQKKDRQCNGRG